MGVGEHIGEYPYNATIGGVLMRNVLLVLTSLLLLVFVMSCARPVAPSASDGIKVHGDWIITVSNPDGGVSSVHEFENALVPNFGNAMLALLLRGEGIMKTDDGTNRWKIRFYDDTTNFYSEEIADTSLLYLGEANQWHEMEGLQLIASYIVPPETNKITHVATGVSFVPSLIPSLKWAGSQKQVSWTYHVTVKDFDKPIPVLPGQEVSATVRISFE